MENEVQSTITQEEVSQPDVNNIETSPVEMEDKTSQDITDSSPDIQNSLMSSKEDLSMEHVRDTLSSIQIEKKNEKIQKSDEKSGNAGIPKSPQLVRKSHIWTTPKSRHITAKCVLCKQLLGMGAVTNVKKCKFCHVRCHDVCILNLEDPLGCLRMHEIFIYDELFKDSRTPLIAFINPKSGAQLGNKLYSKLCNLLGIGQVFNLANEGPEVGLEKFKKVPNLKILVAGGDGTVSWVLEKITQLDFPYNPPVAILPLGTGNDLARQYGWGGGYTGKEKLHDIFAKIKKAKMLPLDRWKVVFMHGEEKVTKIMNNYFSMGQDAEVAVGFHTKRNSNPELFNSRLGNKLWYVYYGSKSLTKQVVPLHEMISLEVDGESCPLPRDLSGLIITNLRSYASGIDLWGNCSEREADRLGKRPSVPRCDDGILEIVGLKGSMDMGKMASGMMKPLKIAQAIAISIVCRPTVNFPDACLQIDGEPWREPLPFSIKICIMDQANLLYNPSGDPFRKKRAAQVQTN